MVQWRIAPGDMVSNDRPLVEVMTNKSTVTVPSPMAAKILEKRGEPGSVVPVHSFVAVMDRCD
ncbi:hypothetical protein HI292_29390 [Corallococcus exiguus]|nr:hypothetical protein [Corallococcus exiguus]